MIRGRGKTGASNVIGTIILVGLTVVLFTALTIFVTENIDNLKEAPAKKDMTTWAVREGADATVYIRYVLGEDLLTDSLDVELKVNEGGTITTNSLDFSDGYAGDVFGMGDQWSYELTSLDAGTEIDVKVISEVGGELLFYQHIKVDDTDTTFDVRAVICGPNEAAQSSDFNIKAYVRTKDGTVPEDLTVTGNIGHFQAADYTFSYSVAEQCYISQDITVPAAATDAHHIIYVNATDGSDTSTGIGYIEVV